MISGEVGNKEAGGAPGGDSGKLGARGKPDFEFEYKGVCVCVCVRER